MGSFQVFRAGAEALAESQLGIKAAATLSEAATTASKFLSEAYPSAKGMIAKASDLFRSPQTASSLSLEGAGEMTAAERAATPGGKSYAEMLEAYKREKAFDFTGTRDLINETRTSPNGFDALSRQVEKLQGIGLSSGGSELPRSLEGIRKSFQPVAANLELGSARSANLHNFVPAESSLATKIQPSTLRYPPIESQVVGTNAARAEKVTAATRAERATATVGEAENGTGAATEATQSGARRGRSTKVKAETAPNGETVGNEAGEATTSGRRVRSRRTAKAAETVDESAGSTVNAKAETPRTRTAKAEAPKQEPAKAEAPKQEPVKAEAPKQEPVKAEAPKQEPVKAEAPKQEPVKAEAPKQEPVKAEAPKQEPVKAEAPKQEPVKAEAPAKVNETATVAEVVEGEATGPAGQNLNRAARRKLERAARHDRRRGPSPQEQEAREYQRA